MIVGGCVGLLFTEHHYTVWGLSHEVSIVVSILLIAVKSLSSRAMSVLSPTECPGPTTEPDTHQTFRKYEQSGSLHPSSPGICELQSAWVMPSLSPFSQKQKGWDGNWYSKGKDRTRERKGGWISVPEIIWSLSTDFQCQPFYV